MANLKLDCCIKSCLKSSCLAINVISKLCFSVSSSIHLSKIDATEVWD